ncbi:hypothetical protein FS764_11390 [Agrobacterium vitis]|uniref:hypothetical protein n=1 Tax=Agrobacterium vitis TaxID=373 RepID=UPI001F2627E6|nr:hypothetical protein [Agrobacterium vitis]MCF1467513.1 hypothetical protein [Agrobacterium vitis]
MNTTSNFIAEIVRAANEVDRLGETEKRRLIDRAVVTIRDMRQTIGIEGQRVAKDSLIGLQIVSAAVSAGQAPDDKVKAALLEAAGMIRDLHIVLDTGTRIEFIDQG